jgi:hypothetical protein
MPNVPTKERKYLLVLDCGLREGGISALTPQLSLIYYASLSWVSPLVICALDDV